MVQNRNIISVSQLNSYIKATFDQDENLKRLYVAGEISNFKRHYPSGHLYFSLKDANSVIRAVMFSSSAKNLQFEPSDGMNVVVCGRVSCYEASGQYQIYVDKIQPEGIGSVYLAFERLKTKLAEEGLFDESLKKPLPKFPSRIGVVTSRTGAVIHDIKTVAEKRYPLCEIMLYPVEVQGERAEKEIVEAIEHFNKRACVDVIIVGRGGGSIEDLWAFNKESVARAVARSKIPIISAVGHETDFTICDFVSDRRAATPSAAAEIALPDASSVKVMIEDLEKRIKNLARQKISDCEHYLKFSSDALGMCGVRSDIDLNLLKVERISENLKKSCFFILENLENKYKILEKRLNFCSEKSVLRRGFARLVGTDDAKIISSINGVREGKEVNIYLFDGTVRCKLTDINIRES